MAEGRHIQVRGRVQGVGFRAWTEATARRLALSGWVRNRADGSVEIEAAGTAAALSTFVDGLNDGPPLARVTAVEVAELDPERAGDLPDPFRQTESR